MHRKKKLSLQNKSNWVLGQEFNCRLVQGTGIPLLVTNCCDNSGFSGVVTLKSPGRVLALRFFPFVNKSSCQLYFPLHINLVGDFFVLPHLLYVIESN